MNRIAEGFDVSRPAISKHLRLLREADLVRETKRGKNRYYRLNAEPLREVDTWLEEYRSMWNSQLRNLERYLENENGGDERTTKGGQECWAGCETLPNADRIFPIRHTHSNPPMPAR